MMESLCKLFACVATCAWPLKALRNGFIVRPWLSTGFLSLLPKAESFEFLSHSSLNFHTRLRQLTLCLSLSVSLSLSLSLCVSVFLLSGVSVRWNWRFRLGGWLNRWVRMNWAAGHGSGPARGTFHTQQCRAALVYDAVLYNAVLPLCDVLTSRDKNQRDRDLDLDWCFSWYLNLLI